MEKLNVNELMKKQEYEGIVTGVPTGMYADRESYGNAPMLAFVLDRELPCKIRAQPYSHRYPIKKEEESLCTLEKMIDKVLSVATDNDNEMLGLAAAFIDQSIRDKSVIEVHGIYHEGIFNANYLKLGNRGFEFPGYKFMWEKVAEENEK